jgi:prepilin-type N-terminal cleavage/methylation domain-containing protein
VTLADRHSHASVFRVGFTLVEVLVALAISGVVGILVTMMLGAVGGATQTQGDVRRAAIKRQVVAVRMGTALRGAARAVASGADHLVLWTGDANDDGSPNLSELRRVAWDLTAGTVAVSESPDDLNPLLDQTFAFNADFDAVTSAKAGSAAFPSTIAVRHVSQWSAQLDDVAVQTASLVSVTLTVACESGDEVMTVTAAMRAQGGV